MNKIVSKSYYKVLFNSVTIIFILPDELEIENVLLIFLKLYRRKIKRMFIDGWTNNVL